MIKLQENYKQIEMGFLLKRLIGTSGDVSPDCGEIIDIDNATNDDINKSADEE